MESARLGPILPLGHLRRGFSIIRFEGVACCCLLSLLGLFLERYLQFNGKIGR